MLPLNQLEGFYMVAVHRGYAAASRAFRYPITQPGVHQQVKKLELELDVKLFERVGRGDMALTPAGRHLFDFVKPFFEALPGVARSVSAGTFGGEVRIDAGGLAIRQVLPPWVRRIRAARKDVRVALAEQDLPDYDRLRTGRCDVLVDFLPSPPDWVATRTVAVASAWLVVPESAAADRPTLGALADTPLVAYPADTPHRALQLQALDTVPEHVMSANSADAILAFVAAGLGFSLIPWVDPAGPTTPGVRAWQLPGASFEISAAWRERTENPLVQVILDAV